MPRTKNLPLSEVFGYARVSTTDQETTLQLDALRRAGVFCIYQEKRSSVGRRPQLELLLSVLSPGAIVKVYKIDRFARSLIDLLSILERIEAAGASFQSLTEPIDTSTPAGRMMMHMLGAFAEFERSIIRDRSMAGQRAAVERGAIMGRPRGLTKNQETKLVEMYNTQKYTIDGIAQYFDCHPSTAKRAIYRVNKPTSSSLT